MNSRLTKTFWPMPAVPECLEVYRGCFFMKFDFTSYFWQLPLDEASRPIFAVATPSGVYMPTRCLQGSVNSAQYAQECTQELTPPLTCPKTGWLDDLLLGARGHETWYHSLELFLEGCRQHNVKISPKKSDLFAHQVTWCGYDLTAEGWRLSRSRLEALSEWQRPQTLAELATLLYACGWMRGSLPGYPRITEPLRRIPEAGYKTAGSRKTKALAHQPIEWAPETDRAFWDLRDALENSVRINFPSYSPDHAICMFTDASDNSWAGIITEVPIAQLNLPVHQHTQHELLGILERRWHGTEARWTTGDQEGYALHTTAMHFRYLLEAAPGPLHIFTDHLNLLYLYDPLSFGKNLASYTIKKVQRWAQDLSQIDYVLEHLSGEHMGLPDLLTRWLRGYRSSSVASTPPTRHIHALRRLGLRERVEELMVSLLKEPWIWPDEEALREGQKDLLPIPNPPMDNGLVTQNGRVVLPADSEILCRVLICAHAGSAGHRSAPDTLEAFRNHFTIQGRDDGQVIKSWCQACLQCLSTKGGDTCPRPLASQLHGGRVGQVVHMDFLSVGDLNGYPRDDDDEDQTELPTYILLCKDDLSGFLELSYSCHANAETTAEALAAWGMRYGMPATIISDRGTHFVNRTLDIVREKYYIHHRMSVPYVAQSNGTVESACKAVLSVIRALISELTYNKRRWYELLPAVQYILNTRPRRRLGGRSPKAVFTHIPDTNPLLLYSQRTDGHLWRWMISARSKLKSLIH